MRRVLTSSQCNRQAVRFPWPLKPARAPRQAEDRSLALPHRCGPDSARSLRTGLGAFEDDPRPVRGACRRPCGGRAGVGRNGLPVSREDEDGRARRRRRGERQHPAGRRDNRAAGSRAAARHRENPRSRPRQRGETPGIRGVEDRRRLRNTVSDRREPPGVERTTRGAGAGLEIANVPIESAVDARNPGFGTRFGPEDLNAIPMRRFSYQDWIKTAPGISPTSPSGSSVLVSAFGPAWIRISITSMARASPRQATACREPIQASTSSRSCRSSKARAR